MDIYTLDSSFHRSLVVDNFESFIWTEKRAAYGDFELVILSSPGNRNLLPTGTRLCISDSYRVMTIETIISKTDAEGRALLTITGSSLEKILDERVAKKTLSNLTIEPKWILTGTPAAIIREIFQTICVDGDLNSGDIIPFVISGNLFPTDTIAESQDVITVEVEPSTVYEAIQNLCEIYDLGFRLVCNPALGALNFNVYSGCDRTTAQTVLPAVVFSPNLDNLQEVSELRSTALTKNVAYVFSKNGFEVVYASGISPTTAGFERRIMLVKMDSVDDAIVGAPLAAILQQKGLEELNKTKGLLIFDGKILIYTDPIYKLIYNLGDLLEMQSSSGITNYMRVTEQIFISDAEGDRSYPTLAIDIGIILGTWLSWDTNEVWDDEPSTGPIGFWDDA